MQEHDVPLPGDEEEGVPQLGELGHHEEEDPEPANIVRPGEAHGGDEPLLHDHESDLDDPPHDTDVGEEGESGVPDKERPLEVHGFPGPHVILTGVNAGQVGHDRQVR